MSKLRQVIEDEARRFAATIVQALRSASLDEVMRVSGAGGGGRRTARAAAPETANGAASRVPARRGGRLGRRSAEDIDRTLEQIVSVLAHHPEGLRSEQIQAALQLDRRELPKPLALGVAAGRIAKEGQKRATTYTLGGEDGATTEDASVEAPPKRRRARKARAKRR